MAWVEHSQNIGRDPGKRDENNVRQFISKHTPTDSDQAAYRQHLEEWFSLWERLPL